MNVITQPLLLPSSWPPGGGEARLTFAHRLRLPSLLLEAKLHGCSLQEEGDPFAFSHKTPGLGVKHLSPMWHNLSLRGSPMADQSALPTYRLGGS